jgi:mono/diheme cytochrome c family protein
MGRFLLGLIFGLVLVPLAVLAFLTYGRVPVAVADPPFPYERDLVHLPLDGRIQKDMVGTHMEADQTNLTAGARIYVERCSMCHGLHGRSAAIGEHMYPDAPPLLEPHHNDPSTVGVSDDPAGETYWKVENGIRLTGMPSFKTQLSDTEIWQVSIFLANASKPMPPSALDVLKRAPSPLADAPIKPAAPPPASEDQ